MDHHSYIYGQIVINKYVEINLDRFERYITSIANTVSECHIKLHMYGLQSMNYSIKSRSVLIRVV